MPAPFHSYLFIAPPGRNNSSICLWNSGEVDSPRRSTHRLRICSLREPGHPAKAVCRESVRRNAVAFSVRFPLPPCDALPRPVSPSHEDSLWYCASAVHFWQLQASSSEKCCLHSSRCEAWKMQWQVCSASERFWVVPVEGYEIPLLTAGQTSWMYRSFYCYPSLFS